MKKKIITIAATLLIASSIVIALASNKAKINKAAEPVKEKTTIPVKVHTVQEDTFNTSFSINGTTSPVREVKIASEVQGKLTSLYIKNGDIVRAGQTIATLDASVFNAQLISLQSSIAKAELDLARYKRLVEMGGASSMQVESLELQQKSLAAQKKDVLQQMSHMQIRAPFSGKIENLAVERGSFVTFGTVLSDLLDISSLKVDVYLSEKEAFILKTGQPVSISSVVLSQPIIGHVGMISDKADASGKFLTEINFSNDGKKNLKAGMLADVSFDMGSNSKGLSIPASALIGSAKQAEVFVINGNLAMRRAIKTGLVTANKIEVTEGLQTGDQVVISGQLNLEDGATISINK